MNIDDIMTPCPVAVWDTTSIGEAWETLRALGARELPVIGAGHALVGIVRDRDFDIPLAAPACERPGDRRASLDAPVSTIMTAGPICAERDGDLEQAIGLMVENGLAGVPVVSPEGRVVGIVSYGDLLRGLGERAEARNRAAAEAR